MRLVSCYFCINCLNKNLGIIIEGRFIKKGSKRLFVYLLWCE